MRRRGAKSTGLVLACLLAAAGITTVGSSGAFDRGVSAAVPGSASTMKVEAIAAGDHHTCAVMSAGGVECWGFDVYGQLGDGTTRGRTRPVAVSGLRRGVVTVAPHESHTCALTSNGGMRCWGWNEFGQLGDGTTTDRHTPVTVSGLGSGLASLSAGSGDHTCAVTRAGGVKCWGYNGHGELGDGTTTIRHAPVGVTGLTSGVVAVATGIDFTCALTSGGAVKCWGFNDYGELGDGTTMGHLIPVGVRGLSMGVIAIAAGGGQTCALTSVGGVKCWGFNLSGELGDGTVTHRLAPVDVRGLSSGVAAIAAGDDFTCALTSAHAVKCWGHNVRGQLGDGTTRDRLAPVDVRGLTGNVVGIAAGGQHACALTRAGGVECWGENGLGELGDGTRNGPRLTPVRVRFAQCTVPNVVGEVLAAARARIVRVGCRVGSVSRRFSTSQKRGRVVAQRPKPGRELARGSNVSLTVSKGPRQT